MNKKGYYTLSLLWLFTAISLLMEAIIRLVDRRPEQFISFWMAALVAITISWLFRKISGKKLRQAGKTLPVYFGSLTLIASFPLLLVEELPVTWYIFGGLSLATGLLIGLMEERAKVLRYHPELFGAKAAWDDETSWEG